MSQDTVQSPATFAVKVLRGSWNTVLSIYYANSLSWRILKSGALFFFGFFLWAGSNILLSYRPEWTLLRYTLAYGFVVIGYGPFHHFVVIPVYQRLRRQGRDLTFGSHLHLPNISLGVFLVLVLILGTHPVGPMTIDFQSTLEGSSADIDPRLACVKGTAADGTTEVHCHLSQSSGIDRVVVKSGDKTIATDTEAPYEFTIREDQLATVVNEKRFRVELLDENGDLIRQYTRSLSMISER
ncbi:MAG: Ig-like domain-containing protein [Halobacteriales archaeon]